MKRAVDDSAAHDSADVESLVAKVADDFIEALNGRDPPTVEEYAQRYPQIANIIRRVFPAITALEFPSARANAGVAEPEVTTGTLGDFRIVREIGRGGMGIVYEAEQISLGRRVALKTLPFAAMLDSRQLDRFKNEARAAATLHHPGIVSVYSVGVDRGVHYYAMQYIEGNSLAETIRGLNEMAASGRQSFDQKTAAENDTVHASAETRTLAADLSTQRVTQPTQYFQSIARLGIQAAVALEHAHEHGILHRDVKPANIMLDADGALRITDFGLARIEADAGVTMTGDVLGTLRYMSPEQALGKRTVLDHRSDIYSLGATLYELMTLQPAFDGDDRQLVLQKIAFEEPCPPRRIDPSIPADLETIVSKSMRKDRDERYASASELADDLNRFLSDEPIRARRPTVAQRATKWAKRHRGFVSSVSAILLCGVIGLIVTTLLVARESRATHEEARRAELHFEMARDAVDRMLTKAAADLEDIPHAEETRRALLDDALAFYQGFLQQKGDSPAIQYETALAFEHVGAIRAAMGDRVEAAEACRRAIDLLEKLRVEFPRDPKYRIGLADVHHTLSLAATAPFEEIDITHRLNRVRLLQQLAIDFPDEPAYLRLVANAQTYVGHGLLSANRMPEAIEQCRAAVATWEQFTARFPNVPADHGGIAYSLHWLGAALVKEKEFDEGLRHLRKSLTLREQLLEQSPASSENRYQAVELMTWIGHALKRQGKLTEAIAQYENAIAINGRLVAEFPYRTRYTSRASTVNNDLAQTSALAGDESKAIDALRASIFHGEALVNSDSEVRHYSSYLASLHLKLGCCEHRRGNEAEARNAFARCRATWENCGVAHPDSQRAKEGLAWFSVACPLAEFQDPARAINLATELLESAPDNPDYLLALGAARHRANRPADALEALSKANSNSHSNKHYAAFLIAMCHWKLGRKEEARDRFDQAKADVMQYLSEIDAPVEDYERHFFQDPELGVFWKEAEALINSEETNSERE